jgi:hypothetical protein
MHQSIKQTSKQSIIKKGQGEEFFGCAKKGRDGATCIVLVRQRMEHAYRGRPVEVLVFICKSLCGVSRYEVDLPWLLCIVIIGMQAGPRPPRCIVLYHM